MTDEFTRAYREHESQHCNACHVRAPYHATSCPWCRKPTNAERAAWFAAAGTSVAEQVDKMTLSRWLYLWARTFGTIACVGIEAVVRAVKGKK